MAVVTGCPKATISGNARTVTERAKRGTLASSSMDRNATVVPAIGLWDSPVHGVHIATAFAKLPMCKATLSTGRSAIAAIVTGLSEKASTGVHTVTGHDSLSNMCMHTDREIAPLRSAIPGG